MRSLFIATSSSLHNMSSHMSKSRSFSSTRSSSTQISVSYDPIIVLCPPHIHVHSCPSSCPSITLRPAIHHLYPTRPPLPSPHLPSSMSELSGIRPREPSSVSVYKPPRLFIITYHPSVWRSPPSFILPSSNVSHPPPLSITVVINSSTSPPITVFISSIDFGWL